MLRAFNPPRKVSQSALHDTRRNSASLNFHALAAFGVNLHALAKAPTTKEPHWGTDAAAARLRTVADPVHVFRGCAGTCPGGDGLDGRSPWGAGAAFSGKRNNILPRLVGSFTHFVHSPFKSTAVSALSPTPDRGVRHPWLQQAPSFQFSRRVRVHSHLHALLRPTPAVGKEYRR